MIKIVQDNKILIEYLETHTHQLNVNNNKRNEYDYVNLNENQCLNLYENDHLNNLSVELDIEGNDSADLNYINNSTINLNNFNQRQIEELNYREQCKLQIKKLEKLINESTDVKFVSYANTKLKECVNCIERSLDKKLGKK